MIESACGGRRRYPLNAFSICRLAVRLSVVFTGRYGKRGDAILCSKKSTMNHHRTGHQLWGSSRSRRVRGDLLAQQTHKEGKSRPPSVRSSLIYHCVRGRKSPNGNAIRRSSKSPLPMVNGDAGPIARPSINPSGKAGINAPLTPVVE